MMTIDAFTKVDLDNLLAPMPEPALSIYLPTPHAGLDNFQNPTRLKTLLAEAEERLADRLAGGPELESFLRPIRAMLADADLWQSVADGLAVFRSTRGSWSWRLPLAFANSVFVGERFHIRPLLPMLGSDDAYYLLAASQNEVRLFSGSRWELSETQLGSLPASLAEALNYQQPEGLFEVRTVNRSLPGKEGGVFHGQGSATQHLKNDLLAYFRAIDRALHDFLRGRSAPLVFAGVDYLFPIYCQANTYPNLWQEPVSGNPQGLQAGELHRRAAELLEPYWQRDASKDLQRMERRAAATAPPATSRKYSRRARGARRRIVSHAERNPLGTIRRGKRPRGNRRRARARQGCSSE